MTDPTAALARALHEWRKVYVDHDHPNRWYAESANIVMAALAADGWVVVNVGRLRALSDEASPGECGNPFHSAEWVEMMEQGAAYNGALLGLDANMLAKAMVATNPAVLPTADPDWTAAKWAESIVAYYAMLQTRPSDV